MKSEPQGTADRTLENGSKEKEGGSHEEMLLKGKRGNERRPENHENSTGDRGSHTCEHRSGRAWARWAVYRGRRVGWMPMSGRWWRGEGQRLPGHEP